MYIYIYITLGYYYLKKVKVKDERVMMIKLANSKIYLKNSKVTNNVQKSQVADS